MPYIYIILIHSGITAVSIRRHSPQIFHFIPDGFLKQNIHHKMALSVKIGLTTKLKVWKYCNKRVLRHADRWVKAYYYALIVHARCVELSSA